MPDPKSRARVERLLSSRFRADDLTGLLLFARDHCDGRESLAEIGHFVAHHQERDKGLVTRSTREWATVLRYHMPRFMPSGSLITSQKLPAAAKDYLRIAGKLAPPKKIHAATRLGLAQAHTLLIKLADRLALNDDGTWALPADYTPTELALFECVSSVMPIRPAFTAERLCDDFLATLKSNGLITKEELKAHRAFLSVIIQLCAVAVMHNSVILVDDTTKVKLLAEPAIEEKKIWVCAALPFRNPPLVEFITPMFTANTDPSMHCDPNLLAAKSWDFEIELDETRRLAPFR